MKKQSRATPEKSTALEARGTYNVAMPEQAAKMANVLKNYIVKQRLYSNIKGKNFAHVDGWQFAGSLMNTYPKVTKVENLSIDKEIKWKADVEIIDVKSGEAVGFGAALCSDKEKIKKGFEEYAILSMAQTRAIGKAYRNRVGWIMKLAGYEATPAEEMDGNGKPTPAPRTTVINKKVSRTTASKKTSQKVVRGEIIKHYCAECEKEISASDKEFSEKVSKDKKPYCVDCLSEIRK